MSAEARTDQREGGVSLREAVAIGRAFVQNAYPEGLDDLQLEEIDRSDDERYWLLTFGFIRPQTPQAREDFTLVPVLPDREPARIYKAVEIEAHTGIVKSMKIRIP